MPLMQIGRNQHCEFFAWITHHEISWFRRLPAK